MLLDTFFGIDVLKALGYGLSGFAFLLMFFAFMLLRQVITKGNANKMVFKSIWAFMALSFIMTITIGIFSYFVTGYKQKELAQSENKVDILQNTSKQDSIAKAIYSGNTAAEDAPEIKHAKLHQDTVLADLAKTVQKSGLPATDKKDFDSIKNAISNITDSLSMVSVPPAEKEALKKRYMHLNTELNRIPQKILGNQKLMNPD